MISLLTIEVLSDGFGVSYWHERIHVHQSLRHGDRLVVLCRIPGLEIESSAADAILLLKSDQI